MLRPFSHALLVARGTDAVDLVSRLALLRGDADADQGSRAVPASFAEPPLAARRLQAVETLARSAPSGIASLA